MAHLPRNPAVLRHVPCRSVPLSPCPSRSFSQGEPSSCFVPLNPLLLLFSRSVTSDFATPRTAACQASLSFTVSQSLLKLMSIRSMMPSSHLILCRPLLLLPSIFPSIRVFSNESALHIRYQSIGTAASASVLPMNIQD